MDTMLNRITDYLQAQSWQIGVLVVAIALISWALRHRSAHVRYLLWLVVLAKCLVPPVVNVPLPVLTEPVMQTAVPVAAPSGIEQLVSAPSVEPQPIPPVSPTVGTRRPQLGARQRLAIVWLIGAGLFVLVAAVKASRTTVWLRRKRKPIPDDLYAAVGRLLSPLGLKRLPRLWLIEGVGQPFVWGLVRGDIYLPCSFLKLANDEHRKGILAHEIGHVLRFDAAVNILQTFAQAIFWFHPLIWWANKRIRAEREKCCDEMAIAHLGAQAREYSTAIINTLIQEQESIRPVPSLAIAGPAKNIEERIRTMMRPGRAFYKRPSLVTAATVMLIMSLTVPTALVLTARAQVGNSPETSVEPNETPVKLLHQAIWAGDRAEVKKLIAQGVDVNASESEETDTPLYCAIWAGHADIVKLLLRNGADSNLEDTNGYPPLTNAIWSSAKSGAKWRSSGEESAKALIAAGADVNKCDPGGSTPLMYAIWYGHKGCVEALLDAGAEIDVRDNNGFTLLYWAAAPLTLSGCHRDILDLILARGQYDDTIHLAACKGDLNRVTALVEQGVDVNAKDEFGSTPLHWAATANSPALAKFLIAKGADVNARNRQGVMPLHMAHRSPVVELLVAKGADVNARPAKNSMCTRLEQACRSGETAVVGFLLSKGVDVNSNDNRAGAPPICLAARGGHTKVVELLLAKGANINAPDRDGHTAMAIATEEGQTEVIKLLLAKGANINAAGDTGGTPLYQAAFMGRQAVVKLLIANGADTNAKTRNGLTPLDIAKKYERTEIASILRKYGAKETLHGAAQSGDVDEVKRLISQGANVNARSDAGVAPLHLTAFEGHKPVVELLLAKGADIQAQTRRGGTPLSAAVLGATVNSGGSNRKDIVEFLLANGADINADTPLASAASAGHKAVVELLLNRGADVNRKNKHNGRTALELAKDKNHTEIVELLRQHGATE